MKHKLVYLICFTAFFAGICLAQPTNTKTSLIPFGTNGFPFVEKHDLDFGTTHAYVALNIEKPVIKAGESVPIEVRLVNSGRGRDFFNLYCNLYTLPSAQIALYDSSSNYLGDLMSSMIYSYGGMSWDDWTYVPGGGSYIGFTVAVRPNYYRLPIQPGDYNLQFIYYKAFIALDPPWRETDPDVAAKRERMVDFEKHFDRSELFRSNPVKLTIKQ